MGRADIQEARDGAGAASRVMVSRRDAILRRALKSFDFTAETVVRVTAAISS